MRAGNARFTSPEFKAKVGLEALEGVKAISEIGQKYGMGSPSIGRSVGVGESDPGVDQDPVRGQL